MNAPLNRILKPIKWGRFKLVDVFDVKNTNSILSSDIVEYKGTVPYLCASSDNNAVNSYVKYDENYLEKGNCLFIGGKTFVVSYQAQDFFSNDSHNLTLYLKKGKKNKAVYLGLAACVYKSLFSKYSWGDSISKTKIKKDVINLPITSTGEIDFDYLEATIAELEYERLAKLNFYLVENKLKNCELSQEEVYSMNCFENHDWKEIRIGDLFDRIITRKLPYKAEDLPTSMMNGFTLPCLTSSFKNQGLNYYAPKEGATVLRNVISIPSNSDVYRAYYQSSDFTVLSDAYAIRWKYEDRILLDLQYLFMVTCINKVTDLAIYSYKNKLGGWNVVKDKLIKVPIKDGKLDYEFMGLIISAIRKLLFKDVVAYVNKELLKD